MEMSVMELLAVSREMQGTDRRLKDSLRVRFGSSGMRD